MKTLLAFAATLALAACGQSGPLRQPDPKPAATVDAPAPTAASPAEKPKTNPSP